MDFRIVHRTIRHNLIFQKSTLLTSVDKLQLINRRYFVHNSTWSGTWRQCGQLTATEAIECQVQALFIRRQLFTDQLSSDNWTTNREWALNMQKTVATEPTSVGRSDARPLWQNPFSMELPLLTYLSTKFPGKSI